MPKGPGAAAMTTTPKRSSRTPSKAESDGAQDADVKVVGPATAPVVRKVKRKKRARR
jgi:hypothetical protein